MKHWVVIYVLMMFFTLSFYSESYRNVAGKAPNSTQVLLAMVIWPTCLGMILGHNIRAPIKEEAK